MPTPTDHPLLGPQVPGRLAARLRTAATALRARVADGHAAFPDRRTACDALGEIEDPAALRLRAAGLPRDPARCAGDPGWRDAAVYRAVHALGWAADRAAAAGEGHADPEAHRLAVVANHGAAVRALAQAEYWLDRIADPTAEWGDALADAPTPNRYDLHPNERALLDALTASA